MFEQLVKLKIGALEILSAIFFKTDWFVDLTDSTVVDQEELEIEGKSTDELDPVIEETN